MYVRQAIESGDEDSGAGRTIDGDGRYRGTRHRTTVSGRHARTSRRGRAQRIATAERIPPMDAAEHAEKEQKREDWLQRVRLAQLATVNPVCGSGDHVNVCTGQMEVPESRVEDFKVAGRIAIDGVMSDDFENAVATFMDSLASHPTIQSDWSAWTSDRAVSAIRSSVADADLGTYDGIVAWFKHLPLFGLGPGNVALAAGNGKPARVNRWTLPGRSPASLANTIVHEAAHEAEMVHKSKRRECGPPYVMGKIVERLEEGGNINPSALCTVGPE